LTQLEVLESTNTQLMHSEETFSKWLITGEEVCVLVLSGSRLKSLVFFGSRHQWTPVWEDILLLGEILGISWQVGSSLFGKAQAAPLIMPSFYKPSSAVQHELLELCLLTVHLFPSLDLGPHIILFLKEKHPLLIPSMLQLLPAFLLL
jgi:hypothetical protein